MSIDKPIAKVINPTNHNRSKQCAKPIRIPRNYLSLVQNAGKSRAQGANGFCYASHWLTNWREILKEIAKRRNHNRKWNLVLWAESRMSALTFVMVVNLNFKLNFVWYFLPLSRHHSSLETTLFPSYELFKESHYKWSVRINFSRFNSNEFF